MFFRALLPVSRAAASASGASGGTEGTDNETKDDAIPPAVLDGEVAGPEGGDLAVDSDDYHTMDRGLFLLVVDPAMTTREFDVERLLERFGARARGLPP